MDWLKLYYIINRIQQKTASKTTIKVKYHLGHLGSTKKQQVFVDALSNSSVCLEINLFDLTLLSKPTQWGDNTKKGNGMFYWITPKYTQNLRANVYLPPSQKHHLELIISVSSILRIREESLLDGWTCEVCSYILHRGQSHHNFWNSKYTVCHNI